MFNVLLLIFIKLEKPGEADENFSQYSRYSDREFQKILEIPSVFLRDFCLLFKDTVSI